MDAESAVYTAGDQLESRGNTTYTYDANGRLNGKVEEAQDGPALTTYLYGSQGQLLQVDTPDKSIEYRHNALGQRVAKLIDGEIVERYLWEDLTTLLAVYDGRGSLKQRFEHTVGYTPTSFTQNGQRYYIQTDHLGSSRVITDSSGSVVKTVRYDSYGNITEDSNPDFEIPFGFAGGLYDADTGLVRFGYRDYDPKAGRWTARDPIGFGGGDTNLYGYVLGDPINYFDPLGLERWFGYTATEWRNIGKYQEAKKTEQDARDWAAQQFSENGANGSLGASASYQSGARGASVSISIGVDTEGNVCAISTVCGRAGIGMSAGVTGTASVGPGTLCSGSSDSVGAFSEGGVGKLEGGSYSLASEGGAMSATYRSGIGGGPAYGAQACHTRTVCF